MLIAYNNDIKFNDRWYHIQTEDNGIKDGHITTTVFCSGQSLDSKSTPYKDAIAGIDDQDQVNQIIKDMMVKQHQMFYVKLSEGCYESLVVSKSQRVGAGVLPVPEPPSPDHTQGLSSLGKRSAPGSGVLIVPRGDNNSSVLPSVNKPDILRASSQQVPGVGARKPSPQSSQVPAVHGGVTSKFDSVVSAVVQEPTRKPSLSHPLPLSKAVENDKKRSLMLGWRGVNWGDADLSMDALVATIMEG